MHVFKVYFKVSPMDRIWGQKCSYSRRKLILWDNRKNDISASKSNNRQYFTVLSEYGKWSDELYTWCVHWDEDHTVLAVPTNTFWLGYFHTAMRHILNHCTGENAEPWSLQTSLNLALVTCWQKKSINYHGCGCFYTNDVDGGAWPQCLGSTAKAKSISVIIATQRNL